MNTKRGIFGRGNYNVNSQYLLPGKKAQITIFIIIGITVLFIFAGILYFTKTTVTETMTAEGEPAVSYVPQEFQAIQTYTENCLNQQAKKGLLILGQQGGYIYPDLVGKYSSSNPTEVEGINLEPLKVPYWHYNKESNEANKVTFASLKPKLSAQDDPEMSIEAQLARFVREHLDSCLVNYLPFTGKGFVLELSETKEVDVKIGESTVNFWLKMPIKAKKGQAENTLDNFYVKVPLNLKHYYEIAEQINDAEVKAGFLEKQGMELISVYSKKDMDYFPPTSDVSFELFSPYSWNEVNLEKKFSQLLTSYVPMLHYLGSSNFYYHVFPDANLMAQKVSDNMILPLIGAEDLEVNFDYFGWKPYFKTNSLDGTIRPEHIYINYRIFGFGINFGMQRYETHYDASYPVMVSIKDKYAFNGEGYDFVFALESNIRNNLPAKNNDVYEYYPPKSSSTLACKEEQKNSGPLKTVVVDSFSKEPIEMVKIGFTIPEQAECEMGFTDKKGELEEKYPAAYGGVVNFISTEYLTAFYPVDTYKYKNKSALIGYAANPGDQSNALSKSAKSATENEKIIELNKLKAINVNFKKKELKACIIPLSRDVTNILIYQEYSLEKAPKKCFFNSDSNLLSGEPVIKLVANGSLSKYHNYYLFNTPESLSEDEEAVVVLNRIRGFREELVEEDYSVMFSVKGNETQEVNLVPGVYEVSISTILHKPIKMLEDKRCFYYDVLTWEKEKCMSFNESIVSDFLTGELSWDSEKTYLVITPEELYSSSQITFYSMVQDIASIPEEFKVKGEDYSVLGRVMEDTDVSGKIANISSSPEYREMLLPRFS